MIILLPVLLSWPSEVVRAGLISSYAMIAAAVFLWITLVIFGIIAKRFQQVLRRKTQWQFILLAPSGILVYAILNFYSSVILGNLKMPGDIQIVAYILFFLSGVFSLIGAFRFRKVVAPRKGGTDAG
ncbi:hypothetical protein KAW18_05245 [candidate division WOR-3 bacterium]|nr:hypothetical protein [candidate division WOR-3 bacterium]MCK4526757.1 hypothetical protein [candidate division WOR-3 bacterium]